jgi:hypothetical protein
VVEVGGDLDRLDGEQVRHVATCASCRAVVDAELGLAGIMATTVPPADPAVQRRVMETLAPMRRRRRLTALVPVVASALMALVGVVMLGGVPGGSLVARLPAVSSQAWLAIAGAASEWSVGMTAAAEAARITLSPAVQLACVLMALAGLTGTLFMARRWRPVTPWQRDD